MVAADGDGRAPARCRRSAGSRIIASGTGRISRSWREGGNAMNKWQSVAAAAIVACAGIVGGAGSAAAQTGTPAARTKPEGEMRFALYVTMPPAWLDPG